MLRNQRCACSAYVHAAPGRPGGRARAQRRSAAPARCSDRLRLASALWTPLHCALDRLAANRAHKPEATRSWSTAQGSRRGQRTRRWQRIAVRSTLIGIGLHVHRGSAIGHRRGIASAKASGHGRRGSLSGGPMIDDAPRSSIVRAPAAEARPGPRPVVPRQRSPRCGRRLAVTLTDNQVPRSDMRLKTGGLLL